MTDALDFHRGLAAVLFDVVNRDDAPEVAYYRGVIERGGEPALDAGCGPGRLLCQYLRAGLDVDGCDISPDMLELCRSAGRVGGARAVAPPPGDGGPRPAAALPDDRLLRHASA